MTANTTDTARFVPSPAQFRKLPPAEQRSWLSRFNSETEYWRKWIEERRAAQDWREFLESMGI